MKSRFTILLLLALPAAVFGQAKPAFPPLPTALSNLGAVGCDGLLYIFGGQAGDIGEIKILAIAEHGENVVASPK
jgi:hypothetical protein